MINFKIQLSKFSKNLGDEDSTYIWKNASNGIEFNPKEGMDSLPIPWDADLSIDDEKGLAILEGGAGCSGFGYACTKVPLKTLSDYVDLEISIDKDVEIKEPESVDNIMRILHKHAWNFIITRD